MIVSVIVAVPGVPEVTVKVVVEEATVMIAVVVIVFVFVALVVHVGTATGYSEEQYCTAAG
jgi:hypothetical protein